MRCPRPPWGDQSEDRSARWPPGLFREGWWSDPRGRLPWRSTLLIAVFTVIGTHGAGRDPRGRLEPDTLAYVLALGAVALLLVRHRHPRIAVYGTCAATLAYFALGYPYGPIIIAPAVAAFAAVVAGQRYTAWIGLGTLLVGHTLIGHLLHRWLPGELGAASWAQELFALAWASAVLAGGELVRTRREQWARAGAERQAARARRADEERLRIARELHDVLAHSISVINVQAGVGLALLDEHPERAREALTTIKTASKEALGEVRQVLDALRAPGGAPRAPAPGLARLAELAGHFADAGLSVAVSGEGPRTPLPSGTDLAAFRIVQEALTNVVRHSASRTARVRVERDRTALRLRVDDDGPAASGPTTGGGNGLTGMRERAAALGGTVEAGPRPDGGFSVLAVLPLGSTDTVSASAADGGNL
ncbi:sensor histidine kinase [Streptomyces polyrhachis]|uniref:histidine kinase n=1 Tax=Streptomyces polyrhachis TaxID=1282885 RepID=A0ABW2GE58_9ACTN